MLGNFSSWIHFDLEVLGHFILKDQARKTDKIHKNYINYKLYQVSMHNSLCQNI